MLVLSRHPGDEIEIGDGIVVKIVSVQGNKVRVGIEAPRGVGVLRRELRERASDVVRAVRARKADQ